MSDSKYQKILIDDTPSSNIPSAKANITVEDWYDMLHHSHPEFQNMSSGGGGSSDNVLQTVTELSNDVNDLSAAIAELTNTVNNLSTLVQQQSVRIDDIIRINTEQTESINTMKTQIDKLEAYVDQDIQIGDDTPSAGAGEGTSSGDGPSLDGDDEVDDDL